MKGNLVLHLSAGAAIDISRTWVCISCGFLSPTTGLTTSQNGCPDIILGSLPRPPGGGPLPRWLEVAGQSLGTRFV